MDSGRIAAVGTHSELLKSSEIYREIYVSQNKASSDEGMIASQKEVRANEQ